MCFIIYYYYLMNPKNITLTYRIEIKIMRSSLNLFKQKVQLRSITEEINMSGL